MKTPPATPDHTLRSMLLGILTLGIVGAGSELLLLGHFEELWQWVPLLVLAGSLVAILLVTLRRSRPTLWAMRGVMGFSVLSGFLGVWRHYRGNVEFELEMYPSLSGVELMEKAVTGATPALSPGTMILLGLLGLAFTYGHPALGRSEDPK